LERRPWVRVKVEVRVRLQVTITVKVRFKVQANVKTSVKAKVKARVGPEAEYLLGKRLRLFEGLLGLLEIALLQIGGRHPRR
jgi:hypothetical protein